ncbi:MAG: DUF488 domain-containing protein [Kiloniellales bacterium]|nr:DUF488 domain-containing protein [Kiloniellales bacterium]
MVRIKRVYAPPAPEDGYRVLVDRLWPRGLAKEAAAVALWLKEIAPSTELRKWFGHDPERWPAFTRRYRAELKAPERTAALEHLRQVVRDHQTVTLLFGARDEALTHAVLLRELLTGPD